MYILKNIKGLTNYANIANVPKFGIIASLVCITVVLTIIGLNLLR